MSIFGTTLYPTPVFNIPHLCSHFGRRNQDTLFLDQLGLMRELETILFPGTKVCMVKQIGGSQVWEIKTREYNYKGPFYIDARFVKLVNKRHPGRKIQLPSCAQIIHTLEELQARQVPYTWGGNWPEGESFFHQLYPSKSGLDFLDPSIRQIWELTGVDCSGLLYYASSGFTPRNTSKLCHFGQPINIEGKNVDEIAKTLKKLDLIVGTINGSGHIIIVLDENTTIESQISKGVVKYSLRERLSQVIPCNPQIRRWHPEQL